MIEQQKTFGEIVGLDPVVPTHRHPNDLVECSDGALIPHCDVCYDCKDNPHSNEDDRFDADVAIVTDILDGVDEWACNYATDNTDYADGYACIVDEGHHEWPNRIAEWVDFRYDLPNDRRDKVIEYIHNELKGCAEWEPQYDSNEYACYSGSGCCLGSFDIGEIEEQTDINQFSELKRLHDSGELDDILDRYNGDAYVSRSKCRVKNENTGKYEYVGRETYNPYGSDCPDIMTYHMSGGQWHFVVPAERMEELVCEALDD